MKDPAGRDDSILFRGVFLVAAATLLFEVSVIRLLSYTIWHHFGYVVISTALLGFGAAGSLLAVRPGLGAGDLRGTLCKLGLVSAVCVAGVLLFVAMVPLHPMSLLTEPRQAIVFVFYQIVVTVPFFFSGLVIAIALREAAERVDRLYFWDLLGAGIGCGLSVPLMNLLTPPGAVVVSAALFGFGAAVFATAGRSRTAALSIALVLLLGSCMPLQDLPFTPAGSKQLSLQLGFGFEQDFSAWKALFRTDLIKNVASSRPGGVGGLSRNAPQGLDVPPYYMNHDATAGTAVFDLSKGHQLEMLNYHVLQLPYLVANPDPTALVIGVGGGVDMIVAKQFGASRVIGVELDPVAVEIMTDYLDEVSSGFFRQPGVSLIPGEGRHFVQTTDEMFDVIQMTGVDTLSAESSGAYVLAENFLYTVEAFADYFDRLKPGGILSFAMATMNPNKPKATGRLVAIAGEALRAAGYENPERHVVVIHSRRLYSEVFIRNEPFTSAQLATLEAKASELDFIELLVPGKAKHPIFYGLLTKTGPELDAFLAGLPYTIAPTHDHQPFFFMFYRWRELFEPGSVTPSHSTALGQIVLGLLAISLTILAGAMILLPLVFLQARGVGTGLGAKLGILAYFSAIGLGFMFFEISLIQRFVMFLGYPTYSLGITLFSLLVFLGVGSFLSRRWVGSEAVVLPVAVVLLALLACGYIFGLPVLQRAFGGAPILVRALIAILMLAPLGLVLGIFFPLGVRCAAALHEDLVPWAWGINGCASVTAGVLAVILAITFGFTVVWVSSVCIYALGVTALLLSRRAVAA